MSSPRQDWAIEWLKQALLEVQEYVKLCVAAVKGSVSRPFYARDVMEQIDIIGLGSLTVVILTGFFTGAVLALQSGMTLDQFGARPFVGRLISGSMMVTEQISALRALGTDPIRKLVVPRVLAGFIMCPILTVVANAVGLTGGWMIALTQLRVPSGIYWSSVVQGLYIQDVWMGLIKPFFLGFVIVTIGCHVGLRTTGGTQGVGRATTNAVVAASVVVLVVDFFVTRLLISIFF